MALDEIYRTLNQLIDSYATVMDTFSSTIADVLALRQDLNDLRSFCEGELADALTARNIWHAAAAAHKAEVEKLREQIRVHGGNDE